MEERQRGASGAVDARRSASPRLRYLEIDSPPLRRSPALSRHLPLPLAPSFGGRGAHRGPLGGEGGAAAKALLHPHSRGPEGASLQGKELAGFRRPHQPYHRNRTCLTGKLSFDSASLPCAWHLPKRPGLRKRWRSIWKIVTGNSALLEPRRRRPTAKPSPNWTTCILCSRSL